MPRVAFQAGAREGASLTRAIAVAPSGEYRLLNCEEGLASRVLHCKEGLGPISMRRFKDAKLCGGSRLLHCEEGLE